MQIIPYGREALLVNFAPRIDLQLNRQVHGLNAALRAVNLPGVRFSTPTYCSLTVGFDSQVISFAELRVQLEYLIANLDTSTTPFGRHWHLPVCFAASFADDRSEVLALTGLSDWQAVIDLLTRQPLHVYMLGFLPGFPYLGVLPEVLACPRKSTPRARVPAQSVSIAGRQAGIYPSASPGGWQIVGRTPVPLFLPQQKANPFLFRPGDKVSFVSISVGNYAEILEAFTTGRGRWKDFMVE